MLIGLNHVIRLELFALSELRASTISAGTTSRLRLTRDDHSCDSRFERRPAAPTESPHCTDVAHPYRPLGWADSRTARNDFGELLQWCHIAERLSRPAVETALDADEIVGAQSREVGALRHVLAQEAVRVLIRPALPRLTGQSGPIR